MNLSGFWGLFDCFVELYEEPIMLDGIISLFLFVISSFFSSGILAKMCPHCPEQGAGEWEEKGLMQLALHPAAFNGRPE